MLFRVYSYTFISKFVLILPVFYYYVHLIFFAVHLLLAHPVYWTNFIVNYSSLNTRCYNINHFFQTVPHNNDSMQSQVVSAIRQYEKSKPIPPFAILGKSCRNA